MLWPAKDVERNSGYIVAVPARNRGLLANKIVLLVVPCSAVSHTDLPHDMPQTSCTVIHPFIHTTAFVSCGSAPHDVGMHMPAPAHAAPQSSGAAL